MLLPVVGWKGVFGFLFGIGTCLTSKLLFFKESLPVERRLTGRILPLLFSYGEMLRNGRFMRYVLMQAFGTGAMFAYIAASPFLFQQHNIGLNAFGLMMGCLFSSRFADAHTAVSKGLGGFTLMCLFVAAALFLDTPVWGLRWHCSECCSVSD